MTKVKNVLLEFASRCNLVSFVSVWFAVIVLFSGAWEVIYYENGQPGACARPTTLQRSKDITPESLRDNEGALLPLSTITLASSVVLSMVIGLNEFRDHSTWKAAVVALILMILSVTVILSLDIYNSHFCEPSSLVGDDGAIVANAADKSFNNEWYPARWQSWTYLASICWAIFLLMVERLAKSWPDDLNKGRANDSKTATSIKSRMEWSFDLTMIPIFVTVLYTFTKYDKDKFFTVQTGLSGANGSFTFYPVSDPTNDIFVHDCKDMFKDDMPDRAGLVGPVAQLVAIIASGTYFVLYMLFHLVLKENANKDVKKYPKTQAYARAVFAILSGVIQLYFVVWSYEIMELNMHKDCNFMDLSTKDNREIASALSVGNGVFIATFAWLIYSMEWAKSTQRRKGEYSAVGQA